MSSDDPYHDYDHFVLYFIFYFILLYYRAMLAQSAVMRQ